jgi:hypothetical protein
MIIDWEIIKTFVAFGAMALGLLSFIDKKWGEAATVRSDVALLKERRTDPEILDRITRVEERRGDPEVLQRITALETRVGPFWRILEENLIDFLKKPIHLEMDDLLDKYKAQNGQLNLDDLTSLKCHLVDVISEYRARKVQRKLEEAEAGLVVGYVFMLGMVESRICEKQAKGESLAACGQQGEVLRDRKA